MNNYCLGDVNEEVTIFIPKWSVGLSSLVYRPVFDNLNQEITSYKVNCKTLDNYCIENNIEKIDYIKIDVEGGEMKVFKGCENMLKK